MYKIVLENNKTKEVITYNDVADLNNGEKLFYKFPINATALEDGEYTLSLYEVGDSEESLIVTDTLCVGNFNVSGLQYKNGEDIYIETKLDTKLEERNVRLEDIRTTIIPSEGYDGMTSVVVNAQPVYDNGYTEGVAKGTEDGYSDGWAIGYKSGVDEQKAKLTSIDITENGIYSREDGYNEVSVNVQGAIDFSVIGYTPEDNDTINGAINADIQYSKELYDTWESTMLPKYDDNLVYFPLVDTSKRKTMSNYFEYCIKLEYVPLLDTSSVTNMQNMFQGCENLKTIPLLDTSSVTNMENMFQGCTKLESVPLLDTSSVTNMQYMFDSCKYLQTIPQFNTSKVTNMYAMFRNCENLKTIPLLDISKITSINELFRNCRKLESVPLLDTSSVTNMNELFYNCENLQTIPQFDTSKVTDMSYMFYYCSKLQSVPLLDASSLTNINSMFGYSMLYDLTYFGGLKNLKLNWTSYGSPRMLPNLTYESVINILSNLYDFRGNGDSSTTRTIELHYNFNQILTGDDKAIATNKGWIITFGS